MATLPTQLNFAATDKSIEEAAGAEFSPNRTFSLFDATLEPSTKTFDVGVASGNYDYNLGVGLDLQVQGASLGSVGIDYPVDSELQFPDAVTGGESFQVATTDASGVQNASVSGETLNFGELDLDLKLSSEGGSLENLTLENPFDPFDLTNLETGLDFNFNGFDETAVNLLSFDPGVSGGFDTGRGLAFEIGTPQGAEFATEVPVSTPVFGGLPEVSAEGSDSLASINANPAELLANIPALSGLSALSQDFEKTFSIFGIGEFGLSASYDVIAPFVEAGYSLVQELTFTPEVVDTSIEVAGQTQAGTLGDAFTFTAPAGDVEELEGTATYDIAGDLTASYALQPSGSIGADILGANVSVVSGGEDDTDEDTDSDSEGETTGETELLSFGPLASPSAAGTTEIGGIELFEQTFDLPGDFFNTVTQNFTIGAGSDSPESEAGQDLAFVIDTTGSMFDDIAAVKSQARGIIGEVFSADRGLEDSRISIVGYNDPFTSTILPFTNQESPDARQDAALAGINDISVGGGGDFPEMVYSGLLRSLDGRAGEWRDDADARKIVLFGDAPPKDGELASQVNTLAENVNADIETPGPSPLIAPASVSTTSLTSDLSMTTFAARDTDESTGDENIVPVQLFTVAIGSNPQTQTSFQQIAEEGGGSSFDAAGSSEIVDALVEVISLPIYSISADRSFINEGDSGSSSVDFTLSRDVAENAATVSLEQTGTVDDSDIGGLPSSVSFAAGEAETVVSVSVSGDTEVEDDETLSLNIADVSESANFGGQPADVTIGNDDQRNEVRGSSRRDNLEGTDGPDQIISLGGSYDRMAGGDGADNFVFGSEAINGIRERDVITDFDPSEDTIVLAEGANLADSREVRDTVVLSLDGGADAVYIRGDGVSLDTVNIEENDLLV